MSRSQSPLRPRAGETTREWYLRSRSSEGETMADFFRRVNRQAAENRAAVTVTMGGKTIEQYNREIDDMEHSVEEMQRTAERWVAVTGYDEANRRFREMPAGATSEERARAANATNAAWKALHTAILGAEAAVARAGACAECTKAGVECPHFPDTTPSWKRPANSGSDAGAGAGAV